MATIDDRWFGPGPGRRGSVAAAFLGLQVLAVGVAYTLDRPTLYAFFIVFSTAMVAYAVEDRGGSVGAAGRFLALQAGVFAAAYGVGAALPGAVLGRAPEVGVQLWAALLVVFVAGAGAYATRARDARGRAVRLAAALPVAAGAAVLFGGGFDVFLPLWAVLYVPVGAVAAARTLDGSAFDVGMATLGSMLLIALGLPLALFVARQTPALIVEKALNPDVHRVLYLGVYGPLLAALMSLFLGVPLAHLLARGFPGQSAVESLVDLPLVVPHSVAGIIILFGFGRGGAFPEVSILGSVVGMVLAMTFVSAPYAVNAAREAFEGVDDRLSHAARIHGASRWSTFRRVTAPLAVRGIVTGGVLAWARAVSEFGAVAVVAYSVSFFYPFAGGTVDAQHAPVFVYNTYLQGGLGESGAVAFLLLGVSALLFLLVRWLTDSGSDTGGLT